MSTWIFLAVLVLFPAGDDELAVLKHDINLLNLLNGLHLTPAQVTELRRVHRELAEVKEQFRSSPASELRARRHRIRALERIKERLLDGKPPRDDLCREANQCLEAKGWTWIEERDRRVAAVRRAGADRLHACLSPEQRQVLVTYKACLVPPQDLRDPVRVGQVNDTSQGRHLLDRLRAAPASQWSADRARILRGMIDGLEKRGGSLLPEQRESALRELALLAEQVRGMSDLEYSLQARDLARQVATWDRHHFARKVIEDLAPAAMVRKNVDVFLLDCRIPELLAEQAAMRVRAPVGGLENVPEADNCEDGECALPDGPSAGEKGPAKPAKDRKD